MNKQQLYDILCSEISYCSKCDLGCELLDGFNPHVPPKGNPNSKLFVCAEGPGKTETEKCCPLIPPGKSGVVYEKMLKELGLTRNDVFTSNSVKCRPPSTYVTRPELIILWVFRILFM